MASISGEPCSGGNIVRNRRISKATNPDDLPKIPPPIAAENPNWFASATRTIVTSARNLLPWDFESESPDDEDSDDEGNDTTVTQGADRLHKKTSSGMIQVLRKPRTVVKTSKIYRVLENLLVQQTFTREACDSLTGVISSRVVESPALEKIQDEQVEYPTHWLPTV